MAKKSKADNRADTRGGGWIGLPLCVYNSLAFRSLDAHARSVLLAIMARFNGYNNGRIAVSFTNICDDLGNSNRRRIGKSIAALVDRGILYVEAEGKWKANLAREYRLTFASTSRGAFTHPATNDYLRWETPTEEKSGSNEASPADAFAGDEASPMPPTAGDEASPAEARASLYFANLRGSVAGDEASPLIVMPYPKAEQVRVVPRGGRGVCPSCSTHFENEGRPKSYCSEDCRKVAEVKRRRARMVANDIDPSAWWGGAAQWHGAALTAAMVRDLARLELRAA